MEACIFCQIIEGKAESSKVYGDDFCLAFMDIQPVNPGHVLVVPKVHFKDLSDLPALMFCNKANGRLNIVYRRADGNISWVDPESQEEAAA